MRLWKHLVGVSVVLMVLFNPSPAVADAGCVTVKGTSSGLTESPNFGVLPFAGSAMLRTSAGPLTAQVAVFLNEILEVRGNVTFASTSHCFVVSDGSGTLLGSFCTEDKAVLAETGKPGLLRLNSRLQIVSGDWMEMPVTGKLVSNGTIQLIPTGPNPEDPLRAVAQWRVKGRICTGE